jgi:hypothetical protein
VIHGADNLAYRIGYVMTTCLFPAIASGTWGALSAKSWSWKRFAITVIAFYFILGCIMVSGTANKN